MKISFNSPVVLVFALLSCTVLLITHHLNAQFTSTYFVCPSTFDFGDPWDYFRMFSHIFGHANWNHYIGNFSFILLIGPILEEKYGSRDLIFMMLVTAVITGILNVLLWDSGLLGASGIVFMMILLGSLVNFRSGTIPLTFILIVFLYLGSEVYTALTQDDQISQFGHIIGGIFGTLFGFVAGGRKLPVKVTS